MARLTALPSIDIIRGFKGILDFYLWKGLPCVRAWPTWRPARQSDASKTAALLFGAIIQAFSLTHSAVLEQLAIEATGIPRTARDIYVSGVFGNLHEWTIPQPPPPPEEQMYDAYVCVRDLKPVTTEGGTFSAGAWRTRDLNDEQADTKDICTLAANQITLAAGTYRCLISCPAIAVDRNQARLYNVSDSAVLLVGTSEHAVWAYDTNSRSLIAGRFTLPTQKVLEVQHRSQRTQGTYGYGLASDWTDELYTIAEFWRETPPA